MISRLIRDGKITEVDISKDGSDRFGFPPTVTIISEDQWKNLQDAVSLPADTSAIKDSKLATAMKSVVTVKEAP